MIRVGFEPTPLRTSALSWRLRPLGQTVRCSECQMLGMAKSFPLLLYLVIKKSESHRRFMLPAKSTKAIFKTIFRAFTIGGRRFVHTLSQVFI